jgi:hypothetical protein
MNRKFTIIAAALAAATLASGATIDNINGSATPPFVVYGGPLNIGWYYTPGFSYNLTGISTFFEPVPNGTGSRTVTLQIRTDRPAVGGTVLGQGTFIADSTAGGALGVTFPSVTLSGGSSYFIDFLNTQGLGVNLGQWANDNNGNPHPSNGATVNLGGWYSDSNGTFPTSGFVAGPAYYQTNTGNVSFAEPILQFQGFALTVATPEPGTMGLALAGCLILASAVLRRAGKRSCN